MLSVLLVLLNCKPSFIREHFILNNIFANIKRRKYVFYMYITHDIMYEIGLSRILNAANQYLVKASQN